MLGCHAHTAAAPAATVPCSMCLCHDFNTSCNATYPVIMSPLLLFLSHRMWVLAMQMVGVNFLMLLKRQGIRGCILADEMGLGKTAQAICFLGMLPSSVLLPVMLS